jgi:hypothetical protein
MAYTLNSKFYLIVAINNFYSARKSLNQIIHKLILG